MQVVGQLWQQSPVLMVMVAGLVSFGVYAIYGYLKDRPIDE